MNDAVSFQLGSGNNGNPPSTTVGPRVHWRDLLKIGRRPLADLLGRSGSFAYALKARGCLAQLLGSLAPSQRRTVLVPSFHCPTVVQSILRAGFEVRFYGVTAALAVDLEHFEQQMDDSVAAVVLIHFFGFESASAAVAATCQQNRSLLIEDWSHSFLRAAPVRLAGEHGDYALYSPWKLVPCGNGGLVRRLDAGQPVDLELRRCPTTTTARLYKGLVEDACLMMDPTALLRRAYVALERIRTGQNDASADPAPEHLEQSREPPVMATFYPDDDQLFQARLPYWCRHVLEHYCLDHVVAERRANYQAFGNVVAANGIDAVYPELDADTCPWAYPMRLAGRRGRDQRLRSLGVSFFTFGEILHPLLERAGLPKHVISAARELSAEMICFPVHQQVNRQDYADYQRAIEHVLADAA